MPKAVDTIYKLLFNDQYNEDTKSFNYIVSSLAKHELLRSNDCLWSTKQISVFSLLNGCLRMTE